MSEASDDKLKRLFAQAPVVGSDESFVASLAADAVARRFRRRITVTALLSVAAVGLAILLAPLAPLASISNTGSLLLDLPDQLGTAAQSAGQLSRGALYIGAVLAIIVLPLIGAVWMSRRA